MHKDQRLQLIRKAVNVVNSEKQSFKGANLNGLYRQAVMLSDLEYTSQQKHVDTSNELDFN